MVGGLEASLRASVVLTPAGGAQLEARRPRWAGSVLIGDGSSLFILSVA